MTLPAWRSLAPLLAVLVLLVAGYAVTLSSREHGGGPAPLVIDGDTLQIDGTIVQLYGIDAPELGQTCQNDGSRWSCGVEAALALRKLVTVSDQKLQCSPWGGGQPKRTADGALIEVCQAGTEDLAEVMLHSGYGVATPGSFPDYAQAEKGAREARLGIWHSDFQLPWIWRQARADPAGQAGAPGDCNVKGKRSADGANVYYVPTDPDYQQITVDPARGERLFCSDEEARLAGWTRPPGPE